MEKVKIPQKTVKDAVIEINGQEVEVVTHLSLSDMIVLINDYVMAYFLPSRKVLVDGFVKPDYITAEYTQKLAIIDKFTSIDMADVDFKTFRDSWFDLITSKIENYQHFREMQERVISDIKEEKILESQVGSVLDAAFEMLKEALGKLDLQNMPKEMEKAQQLLKEMEESPVASVFKESKVEKKKSKNVSK